MCSDVCMCVCLRVCMTYLHTNTFVHTYIIRMRCNKIIRTVASVCACIHTYTYTYTHTHACMAGRCSGHDRLLVKNKEEAVTWANQVANNNCIVVSISERHCNEVTGFCSHSIFGLCVCVCVFVCARADTPRRI